MQGFGFQGTLTQGFGILSCLDWVWKPFSERSLKGHASASHATALLNPTVRKEV